MEIERKFTVKELPGDLSSFSCLRIEQAYLNTDPVIRIRRQDEEYYLTYKGKGLLSREEYNLPLNRESYYHLRKKADGNIICKTRYLIPLSSPCFTEAYVSARKISSSERNRFFSGKDMELMIELDVFDEPFSPLVIAEVEFTSEEMAAAFLPPDWFLADVTMDPAYHNSTLSRRPL